MRRAQLSLSVVEAAVGVLVVFAVTTTFLVGVPPANPGAAQLDAYARDTATLLANEPADEPGLDDVLSSRQAFLNNRSAVRDRVASLLPANVLYRVETPRGAVGYPRPPGATTGVARVPTEHGAVTVWTWYA